MAAATNDEKCGQCGTSPVNPATPCTIGEDGLCDSCRDGVTKPDGLPPLWQVARDAYEKNNPDAADGAGQWTPGTPQGVTGDSLYEFVCNEVEDVTEGIDEDDPKHEGRVMAARGAHEALDRAVLQLMDVRNALANEVRRAERAAGLPVTKPGRVSESAPIPRSSFAGLYGAERTEAKSNAQRKADREARAVKKNAEKAAKAEARKCATEERRALIELEKTGGVFAALVACAMDREDITPEAAARFYLDEEQGDWWGDGSPGSIAHLVNEIEAAIVARMKRDAAKLTDLCAECKQSYPVGELTATTGNGLVCKGCAEASA